VPGVGRSDHARSHFLVKDAAAYVRKQYQPKAGEDMQKRFPGASPATVDLLAKTLFFDPKKRIRIDDALAHPCFQEVQSNASQGMEKTARVDLAFDQEPELDERTLRRYFLANLKKFRPDIVVPPELA